MKIKYKFLISFGIIIVIISGILLYFFYYTSEKLILTSIKSQIRNVSKNIVLNYKKNVALSIKNYLRAISESMASEIKSYYKQVKEKKLKKVEAINQIEKKINERIVGKTGYIFILNKVKTPIITFEIHPILKNQNASEYDFVQQIISTDEGYIEYQWKEFGEIYNHKKSMYFLHFSEWNWILCTTVIMEELNYLLTTEDLKDDISSLEKNKGESISIIDNRGNVLCQDIYEGDNIYDKQDITGKYYIREICNNKTGELTYQVMENKTIENKLVIYEYYEEMNWIFIVDNYLKEIFHPLYVQAQNIIVFIIIIAVAFILLLLLGYSIVFLKPINKLKSILTQASKGNLAVEYNLKKIDYSSINEFNVNNFTELRKKQSYCFFEIGTFALEIGQETKCPALLSGKYKNCPGCYVYKTICDNEFNTIGAWFNHFIWSLQEIEKSANFIARGNLTKDIVNQSLKGDLGKAFMIMSKNLLKTTVSRDSLMKEVAERKKAEKQLYKTEQKYRKQFEGALDAIFVAEVETGIIVDCNLAATELVERKKSELIGQHQRILHPPELADEEYSKSFTEHLKEKKGQIIETKVITKNGKLKDVAIKANRLEIDGKKILQGIFRDITNRKKAEKKLQEYVQDIEEINKELDDFTYIISHDLKEPLRSIDAFSKFIEKDYKSILDEDGKNYLKRIRINCQRMQSLIEDLLEVSRLGRKKNPFEQIKIEKIIKDVQLRFERVISEKNAKIIIQTILPNLFCDRVRLTEVFANLLSNALKFNDKPQPIIEIGCNDKGDVYEFYFKDNGPGIKKQYFDKIFEIFQRLGKKEDKSGTGVGLTITKKIIELHNGKIWVKSELGEGTKFYFTIPKKGNKTP